MIYGHGDDLYQSEYEVVANFSTNVWYGADPEIFRKLLTCKAESVLHYPEPDALSFRQAVAAYHGLLSAQVIAGNGATELFYLVAHAFAGNYTVLPVPSFTEYEDACTLYDHRLDFITREQCGNLSDEVRLMFICNPNNPDGRVWSKAEIAGLLEKNTDMTLIVDESFVHFAPEAESVCPLLADYPNLLVVRSMTKSYAIPGLRLGYMLGNPDLIEFIACYKQPWTVNALAIELGKYLLQSADNLLPDPDLLLRRQRCFSKEIGTIPGFCPLPSQTSFFLVQTKHDVPELKRYLLKDWGILIRDASNFRGLDRHYFRINTLTDDKNDCLISALRNYGK